MFALPQAMTSAPGPARAADKKTPHKVDDSRSSVFGGGSRGSATSAESMPSTPRTRPSGDTDISSILIDRVRSSNSGGRRYGTLTPTSSAQASIGARSPSVRQQKEESGQKKSIMSAFGLRSKKSIPTLSTPRTVSAETWQTIASDDTSTSPDPHRYSQRAPTPASSIGFFNRNRVKGSPRTPTTRKLSSPRSMSSLMSTDSLSTIATVSPIVGRSSVPPTPVPPTPLRYSSFPDASETSILDPNAKITDGQLGLPSAELAETDPHEWSKYVEAVRREVRKQEEEASNEPLVAPPENGTSKEMREYAVRKRVRTDDKVKLATQFLHHTSSCGFILKDGWQEGYPHELSVYETIAEWERKHVKQDPDMKKTVLGRLFKKNKQEASTPTLSLTPSTDPDRTLKCPSLDSREESTWKSSYDDATDRPLASSPDLDHYQLQGLGISALSTSRSDQVPRTLSSLDSRFHEYPLQDFLEPSSAPGSYTSSLVTPGASSFNSLPRDDKSGWETVVDEELDIDDDLIEAANAFGSTPDLRRKFDEQEAVNSLHPPTPPVPELSSAVRERYANQALPAPPSAPRHSSILFVRRDSTRRAFSPKLESKAQQAEFDRGIQAAAQRRIHKLSKVPVATGHPALRIKTGQGPNLRSTTMPAQLPKVRGLELPTPTKAKPVKPVKPHGLGTRLALRKMQEEQSPSATTSQMSRPPKYGQHISPGKSLDSPKASDGAANLNSAPPLPVPNRPAVSTEIPLSNCGSTISQPDQDDHQECASPMDDQMDNVVNAWRGPRTPSMPMLPSYDESPSMRDAQRMRERLGLPLLEHKRESDPPHPNHKYAWDTMNLMCMGIHRGAYEPVSTGPPSPLGSFGSLSSAIRTESYNTFDSIDFNYEGKSCHICKKTCCYYTEQLALMNIDHFRNPAIQAIVATAHAHEQELRKEFPSGVEKYDAHIKCSDCGAICCHEHGVVCKTLSCRAALCVGCSEDLGGRCRQHRDSIAEAIRENGARTDSLVRSLQERIDDEAVNELMDNLL